MLCCSGLLCAQSVVCVCPGAVMSEGVGVSVCVSEGVSVVLAD